MLLRLGALAFGAATAAGALAPSAIQATERAVFAGGCYWGVEAVFEHVRGVRAAVSGFSEGVESVEVRFDPAVVSILFHRNAAQRAATEAHIDELRRSARFSRPIVTELKAFRAFTPVPPDQQDYVARNPRAPYVVVNDLPKPERLRREFPQLYVGRN